MLKAKIHRATVTQAELNYVGSITIDSDLLEASGIREYEKVDIVNINNGERFATYTIAGAAGSGVICLNGAADISRPYFLSMRKISWFGSLIMKNTDIWKTKPVIPPKMEHLAVDR